MTYKFLTFQIKPCLSYVTWMIWEFISYLWFRKFLFVLGEWNRNIIYNAMVPVLKNKIMELTTKNQTKASDWNRAWPLWSSSANYLECWYVNRKEVFSLLLFYFSLAVFVFSSLHKQAFARTYSWKPRWNSNKVGRTWNPIPLHVYPRRRLKALFYTRNNSYHDSHWHYFTRFR